MKKIRLLLGAAALVLSVGTVFAVKANAHRNSGDLYFLNPTCVQDLNCHSGTGSPACTGGTHYTDAGCSIQATSSHKVTD